LHAFSALLDSHVKGVQTVVPDSHMQATEEAIKEAEQLSAVEAAKAEAARKEARRKANAKAKMKKASSERNLKGDARVEL
jgi:hypothetical protein